MSEIIATIIIGVLFVSQIIERRIREDKMDAERKQWIDERSRLLKAIMAKNISEYNSAVLADKVSVDIPDEPDEVPQSEASDELFDKHIKTQTQ